MTYSGQQGVRFSHPEILAVVNALEFQLQNNKKLSEMEIVVTRSTLDHMNVVLNKAFK